MRKRVLAALLTGAMLIGSIMPAAAAPVTAAPQSRGDRVELIHVTLPGESEPTVFEVINDNYPDIPGMQRIPGTSQYVELSPIDESDQDLIPFEEIMAEAALYNGEPTEAELLEAEQNIDTLEVDGDVSDIQEDDVVVADDDIIAEDDDVLEMEEDAADAYIDPEYLIDASKYNISYYDEGEDPEEKAREAAKTDIADNEEDEPVFVEIEEDEEDIDLVEAYEEDADAALDEELVAAEDEEEVIEISGDDEEDIIAIEDDDQDIEEADEEAFDADETVGTPTASLIKTSFPYPSDGNPIEPAVEVKDGDKTIDPKYYRITYPSYLRIGENTVNISFYEGNYQTNPYYGKGSFSLKYIINPPKPTISSVNKKKLNVIVNFKPIKGNVSLYVEYADNEDFKNATRENAYISESNSSKTIYESELKNGKTYYFRAAAYYSKWNSETSSSEEVLSNWSNTKSIKYTVNPPKPTISSVKEDKSTLDVTVTLKPIKNEDSINFYVEYADNKNFKNAKRESGYSSEGVISKTISSSNFLRGKTYYFRAATYYSKWNDKKDENEYFLSDWSSTKTLKTGGKYIVKESAVSFMNWKNFKSIKSSYKKTLPASVKKLAANQEADVYYDNGKLSYFIVYTNHRSWDKNYDKDKESCVESFDAKGKRTGKVVFTKDAEGEFDYYDQYYTDNKVVYPMEVIENKDGKVTRRNYYNANKKKLVRYTTYKYKTSSSGRTEEEYYYNDKGKLTRKEIDYYDKTDYHYGSKTFTGEKSTFSYGTWYTKSKIYNGYYFNNINYNFSKKNYTKTSQYDSVYAYVTVKKDGNTTYDVNFNFDKNGKETSRTYDMREYISDPYYNRYMYYDSKKKVTSHSEYFDHSATVDINSYYR